MRCGRSLRTRSNGRCWRISPNSPQRPSTRVLRVAPVTPFTARIIVSDFEHRGVTFPAGTIVMICAHAANRDEAGGGPAFDITREGVGKRALTFGAGIHYCLGANLARAELGEALAFLAPRMQGLELDGEPGYDSVHGIYGLLELPVRWNPV